MHIANNASPRIHSRIAYNSISFCSGILSMPVLDQPLKKAELDELDELLLVLAERAETEFGEETDSVLCVSELDGFFAALVSGPEMVPPSEWYPAVWGGHTPVYESEAEAQHVFQLLVRHMNDVASALHMAPDSFEPMFQERIVEGRRYTIVDEWCYGYMRGVDLRRDQWQQLLNDSPQALDAVELFAAPQGWEALEKLDDMQIEQLQAVIPGVVRDLHAYWLRRRAVPVQRCAQKTGRNEPCPCGSGRKYKQCCLH
jgi:uncharacterized protein